MNPGAFPIAPSANLPKSGEGECILFVPEIVAFGGGERLYLALSRYLNHRDVSHRIVSYHQRIDLQAYADWPLHLEELAPPASPKARAQALSGYLRDHTRRNPAAPPPLLVGLQAAMHAATVWESGPPPPYNVMILDTPRLMTAAKATRNPMRALGLQARETLSRFLTRRGLRRAQTVSIMTDITADEVAQLYRLRPQIIRPGVIAPGKVRSAAPPLSPLRLLSVCRLEPNKRLDWIIKALADLERGAGGTLPLSHRISWHLDIVGTGSLAESLPRLAQEFGVTERTTFHGAVSDARLEELYREAHLFLMPAVQGYGLPALEALTRRVPVVMHQDSGVGEILGGTPWVKMIRGTNADCLAQGIAAMAQRLLAGTLREESLPPFPTEAGWAQEVCRWCGWEVGSDVQRGERHEYRRAA